MKCLLSVKTSMLMDVWIPHISGVWHPYPTPSVMLEVFTKFVIMLFVCDIAVGMVGVVRAGTGVVTSWLAECHATIMLRASSLRYVRWKVSGGGVPLQWSFEVAMSRAADSHSCHKDDVTWIDTGKGPYWQCCKRIQFLPQKLTNATYRALPLIHPYNHAVSSQPLTRPQFRLHCNQPQRHNDADRLYTSTLLFFFCSTLSNSALLICGSTPPKAMVARISVSSSSSPRMAS
jgi:hypothetical protein